MKRKGIVLLFMVAACTFLPTACRWQEEPIEKNDVLKESKEGTHCETELDVYEKGYDLPIDDSTRKESEEDCKEVMKRIQMIYKDADKGDALNAVISRETAGQMMEVLKTVGYPVSVSELYVNMGNYEKMEDFLDDSLNGKRGEIVIYVIRSDGGVIRLKFIFDGTDMYVLNTRATWSEENTPVISFTAYNRIKEWEYTEKGWFLFEYCVPEVSEVVIGNVMIRVKPTKKEYNEIAEHFLLPLGYQGNNLLCSNWDAEHMEDIDYNGLFQYLYAIKYSRQFDSESYTDGIPKEEFENLMMEYLPVTAEQLERYAVFDAESQTYAWVMLGCGNYTPSLFGTSIPEVTKIKEHEDGTVTLTVDAVCEMLGNDAVMSHQLTVELLKDGGVRYLENQVLGDGLVIIPKYQRRFENK